MGSSILDGSEFAAIEPKGALSHLPLPERRAAALRLKARTDRWRKGLAEREGWTEVDRQEEVSRIAAQIAEWEQRHAA